MSLVNELSELVGADVISEETAQKISAFYNRKKETSPNRQLLIFGILGALLVGSGLMFIIANQWEEFSKPLKIFCSYLLMLLPQGLVLFVMIRKGGKIVWREIAGLLLFFAVGSYISLMSQIYEINGQAYSFLMFWMLLALPVIYILDSAAVSLACLVGIMSYGLAARFGASSFLYKNLFWLLILVPLPFYLKLLRKAPGHFLTILHHWVIPFVLTMSMSTMSRDHHELIVPAYVSMFGLMLLVSNSKVLSGKPLIYNGYRIFGYAGTVITLLVMTFKGNWTSLMNTRYSFEEVAGSSEFAAILLFTTLAAGFWVWQNQRQPASGWKLVDLTFLVFGMMFILGFWLSDVYILVDLYLFLLAVRLIRQGSAVSHLGILNTGLSILALLVVCRAFDTDLSMVFKGSLFVLVGLGFFMANWWLLKKRGNKTVEQSGNH